MILPLRPIPSALPPDPQVALARSEMRQAAIARRKEIPADHIAAWSRSLCDRLATQWPQPPGRIIGFCWPMQNEPDIRPLMVRWRTQGASAVLPVVVAPGQALLFRPWHPDTSGDPLAAGAAMVPDRFGIPTPVQGPELIPDVLLLPLNAFDAAGYRIGYGGGFFDRTLAALTAQNRRPLVIGVGFEIGRVTTTYPQPHDERLDWIVTESGLFKP